MRSCLGVMESKCRHLVVQRPGNRTQASAMIGLIVRRRVCVRSLSDESDTGRGSHTVRRSWGVRGGRNKIRETVQVRRCGLGRGTGKDYKAGLGFP